MGTKGPSQYKDVDIPVQRSIPIVKIRHRLIFIMEITIPGRTVSILRRDPHYSDVIKSAIASQITGVFIVCSTVSSGADQRKHQSSASLAFVWESHWWPENSPHNTSEFPAQKASNAENASIWWRHYAGRSVRVRTDVPQSISSPVPLFTSPYVSQSRCSPVPIFPHEVRPMFPSLCVSQSLCFPVNMSSSPFIPHSRYSP